MIDDVASELIDRLVAAYAPYLSGLLEERAWPEPPGWRTSLARGERWLRTELEELLSMPFREQPHGPLEVFQMAVRFAGAALAKAGITPVVRDRVVAEALPEDVYDLAPASSRRLGEEVWAVHLRWGAAKAAAFQDG